MRSKKHWRWIGGEDCAGRVLSHSKEFEFSSQCDGKLLGGFNPCRDKICVCLKEALAVSFPLWQKDGIEEPCKSPFILSLWGQSGRWVCWVVIRSLGGGWRWGSVAPQQDPQTPGRPWTGFLVPS